MRGVEAIGAGLAGAVALTVLHETVRHARDDAPRMDVLGERAIAAAARGVGAQPPAGDSLHRSALAGDIVANTLFYSLVGLGHPAGAWWRGTLLGITAGVGAVMLPGPLGLGRAPSNRTTQTGVMTVAWYVAGGLAAATAFRLFAAETDRGRAAG